MEADQDGDGKLNFEEFALMVSNTVSDYTLVFIQPDRSPGYRETNDVRGPVLVRFSSSNDCSRVISLACIPNTISLMIPYIS